MLASNEKSGTRRAFFKVVGALTSFIVFVKCKTTGDESGLLADDPNTAGFMEASRALTGFNSLDAALGPQYLTDLKMTFGDDQVKALVDKYKDIQTAGGDVEGAIASQIMGSENLAKVAGASIMLWYHGTFNKLQTEQPIAVKAYQKGLVWQTFKGKPMGIPDEQEGVWGVPPGE